MKKLIKTIIMFLGTLTLILIVAIVAATIYFHRKTEPVPRNTILKVDFEKNYEEYLPREPLGRLLVGNPLTMHDIIDAILKASGDDRVRMLVAKIGAAGMQVGKIQELRDAVAVFRKSGKKTIAFSESFGEFNGGTGAYYLASAFDQIYLQPSGSIGLTGLGLKTPFIREFLDKIGIDPELAIREEYKSAAYTFTKKEYPEPQLEEDRALLKSLISQVIDGISKGRKLDGEHVNSLMDNGPFTAKQALVEHLIDGMEYRDQVHDIARKEAGTGSQFLSLADYLERAGSYYSGKKKIAVIYCVGPIVRGKSQYAPFAQQIIGSETIGSVLQAAAKDTSVEAIILRVDSPGGSYIASDTIWREIIQAKNSGKPVIASMGDVAASGGYFISVAADKIIAHPGTLTGSIGVISGKMVTSELWQKIGIHWGELFSNKNGSLWSSTDAYTPAQWQQIQGWMDEIYGDFLNKVATGRHMDIKKVHEVAKGRVWSGSDAKKLGLVDELGDFETAVRAAKAAAGIPETESVGLKLFPTTPSIWKILLKGNGDVEGKGFNSMKESAEYVESWMSILRKIGFDAAPYGMLRMREMEVEGDSGQ